MTKAKTATTTTTPTTDNLDLKVKVKYSLATSRLSKSATSKLLTANSVNSSDMLFMPLIRRRIKNIDVRYLLAWLLSIIVVVWFMNSTNNLENCYQNKKGKFNNNNVEYVRLLDDADDKLLNNNYDSVLGKNNVVPYNRNMPLVFVGGVPR